MYTYLLGVSRNGRQVYANIINSVAGRSISRQPYLVAIAKTLVETLDLTDEEQRITQDMGRTIGNTNVVATSPKDVVFYACQSKQTHLSRFVKNRSMEPSRELSMVLVQDNEGNYELTKIWIGPAYPPFPDAPDARKDSKDFWQTHALTDGSELFDSQSVTRTSPY